MVRWTWHPTVLVGPKTGHGMFSGTGFFTRDGKPAIVYHGQGSDKNWIQIGLDDELNTWSKPMAVLPKEKDGSDAKMRHWDPDCWLNGDTYYAISGGQGPHLSRSTDLENWTHLGLVLHDDMPDIGVSRDEDISCANMFKLGSKWMLLCISHRLGCRYYLGDFKDEKYLPMFHAMMNWHGWDYFAPESLLTPDGRRVAWAWCRVPGAQSAVQGLPRELSLPADGVLRIRPLRELAKLRYDAKSVGPITVKDGVPQAVKGIAGNTMELEVVFTPGKATEYGVEVLCDAKGKGFPIAVRPGEKVFAMGSIKPPFEPRPGEAVTLRIFLDRGMVEVFADDRQAAVWKLPHVKENVGVRLFAKGGDVEASVKSWQMKSIY